MLEHAGDALRADKQVVLATVRQTGIALQCASEEICRASGVTRLIALTSDTWRRGAAQEMCADREVVMEAVRHPRVASCVGVESEVMLRCRQNGLALEFACEKLRADRELVRTAVCQEGGRGRERAGEGDGFSVAFASPSPRLQDGLALALASAALRGDREARAFSSSS